MSIPIYVDELAKSVTDRLSMLEDGEYFDFAFLTDPHNCVDYVERSLYAAVKICETYPLEFFCFGGDYLCNNPYTKREEALCQHRELAEVIKKYKDKIPVIVVKGNHDDNPFGGPENRLMPSEIYDILMTHHSEKFISDDKTDRAMYGYYDMPHKKFRAVYLNVFDPEYINEGNKVFCAEGRANYITGAQLDWLYEKALVLPESGWSVAVFAHCLPIPAPFPGSERFFGGDALVEVLAAFIEGRSYRESAKKGNASYDIKCDFKEPGNLIGFFCGHYHRDWFWKVSGIPVITQSAAASDNFMPKPSEDGTVHKKTRGSGEETTFSVFRVYPEKREVYCLRCGAGPDFSYKY